MECVNKYLELIKNYVETSKDIEPLRYLPRKLLKKLGYKDVESMPKRVKSDYICRLYRVYEKLMSGEPVVSTPSDEYYYILNRAPLPLLKPLGITLLIIRFASRKYIIPLILNNNLLEAIVNNLVEIIQNHKPKRVYVKIAPETGEMLRIADSLTSVARWYVKRPVIFIHK